jgi:hypothetical protein
MQAPPQFVARAGARQNRLAVSSRDLGVRSTLGFPPRVREGRVELPRPFGHRILSPARLPFRHSRGGRCIDQRKRWGRRLVAGDAPDQREAHLTKKVVGMLSPRTERDYRQVRVRRLNSMSRENNSQDASSAGGSEMLRSDAN